MNELEGEESFEHISVLKEISRYAAVEQASCSPDYPSVLLPDLKQLQNQIKLSKTVDGDGIFSCIHSIDGAG